MIRLFAICIISGFSFFHDFHTSIAELNYNPKTEALEISLRVFTDDLERVLTTVNNGNKITLEYDDKILNPLIELYLKKNFALVSDTKKVKLAQYYGREKESDATWLYFEIIDCKNLRNYTLYNSIFQETFNDQTNVVNIKVLQEKHTLVFDNKTKTKAWPF